MYDNGQGVLQDYVEAARWYRRAAEQGVATAQANLADMYAFGRGVPQDYVLAHMWFNLAASRYPASEIDARKKAIHNRDLVASKMTPAQIAEAQRLAREWKPKKEK
jgi:TPR repeat protein